MPGRGSRKANQFQLEEEDYQAIELGMNVIRLFLKQPRITPNRVVGLGYALLALQRMPSPTQGAEYEFGIRYLTGTDEFWEMRSISFRISDSTFEISHNATVTGPCGSDTISAPGWLVEVGGYRCGECDLYELEHLIKKYLNLGADIFVHGPPDTVIEE